MQLREIRPETVEDMFEIAVHRDRHFVDLTAAGRIRLESRFDLFLLRVGELASVVIEELDAVVFRWIVRSGDHGTEIEREEGHGRRRQHSSEHG